MKMVVVEMEAGVFVRISEQEAAKLGKLPVAKTQVEEQSKNKAAKPTAKKAAVQPKEDEVVE